MDQVKKFTQAEQDFKKRIGLMDVFRRLIVNTDHYKSALALDCADQTFK